MERYKLSDIANLASQLKRGPRRLRLRQLLNIQFLLTVVERGKLYPFEFVCHVLTGYRPASESVGDQHLLDGELLTTDLVLLAEDLSEDAALTVGPWIEPLFSVNELAARFDVSTKTIFRWRRRGLVGWKFRFEDHRKRLLFPDRCVRQFVAHHAELVTRGAAFSQLSDAERKSIVERARVLVQGGQRTVNAVARQIASETGRAVETIRLILKSYSDAHPEVGLFNRLAARGEGDELRLAIWEAYSDGASVEALAQRFGRPATWVYRLVTQMRARQLKQERIEYIASPEFDDPEAEQRLLHEDPPEGLWQSRGEGARRVPSDLPPYLAQLFRLPLLTPAGEVTLFRRMNYLRYRAARRLAEIDPESVRASELDEIERLLAAATAIKNDIVQANLRLVVSIAKRHVRPHQDLFELVSDGNVSLMRAVDKFDYTRGFKFSTYASWAVIRNFARTIPEQHLHHERYQTGWDEVLERAALPAAAEGVESDQLAAMRGTLERMLESLDLRERTILRQRYGLEGRHGAQTLEQIGQRLGVSKERIRQLESRAIAKLRASFANEVEKLLGS